MPPVDVEAADADDVANNRQIVVRIKMFVDFALMVELPEKTGFSMEKRQLAELSAYPLV